jgi:hypothetical protein
LWRPPPRCPRRPCSGSFRCALTELLHQRRSLSGWRLRPEEPRRSPMSQGVRVHPFGVHQQLDGGLPVHVRFVDSTTAWISGVHFYIRLTRSEAPRRVGGPAYATRLSSDTLGLAPSWLPLRLALKRWPTRFQWKHSQSTWCNGFTDQSSAHRHPVHIIVRRKILEVIRDINFRNGRRNFAELTNLLGSF